MAFCSNCGAQIGEGDAFCNKCGVRLAQVVSQQPVISSVTGTSGLAIAALVLGILGFLVAPLSIGAIICGVMGINRTGVGKMSGHGMAVAGLVLGCIAFVVWVYLLIIVEYWYVW